MREITEEEFYRTVCAGNVHPVPLGPYPYTTEMRTPSGMVRGKIVSEWKDGNRAVVVSRYFTAVTATPDA